MSPYSNTSSTIKLQTIFNQIKGFPDIEGIPMVAGNTTLNPLFVANDVINAIMSVAFPWKWADVFMPQFVTNSYQQDYLGIYPNGTSVTNLSWLERGIVVDINNTAQPKPYRLVEVGRQLPQATGIFTNSATNSPLFLVNYFPNSTLYCGTWGAANVGTATLGNNPVAGSVYTNPIALVNGQAQSMPDNPITQIQDANGNLLALTTYGVEGITAPLAPPNSAAGVTASGSGATTVWTVVDPNGQGFRILPVPSQTGVVWQFNLWGQMLPPKFTSMQQTLAPLPDQYEPNFRQMLVAQLYRYSPEAKVRAKFHDEWALAMKALENCRVKSDRELEENVFSPDRGIMSTNQNNRASQWPGGSYPFNLPAGY